MVREFSVKIVQVLLVFKTVFVMINFSYSVTPSNKQDNTEGSLKNSMWNATTTDLLKRDLFLHYDKFSRPSHHTNITTVNIDFQIKHIELDDTKFVMTVSGWLTMSWQDEKLKWNESKYDGIGKLVVADHEIWQPDIVPYGSSADNAVDHYGNVYLLVESDGSVLWVPPCKFQEYCMMDLTKWPYDKHSCNLNLTSWMYGGDGINLTVTETTNYVEHFNRGQYGWNVTSIKAKQVIKYYTCCDYPYYIIVYTIKLERFYSSYTSIIFPPIIGVGLISLVIFWFPINSSSRFYLGGLNAVIQTVLLVYFLQRLVKFGNNTPRIVTFFACSLILNGISMVGGLLCYRLATNHRSMRLPWTVKNIKKSNIFNALFLQKCQHWSMNQRGCEELVERSTLDEDREDLTTIGNQVKRPVTAEWVIVATALDSLIFYLYILFYIGFAFRCLH